MPLGVRAKNNVKPGAPRQLHASMRCPVMISYPRVYPEEKGNTSKMPAKKVHLFVDNSNVLIEGRRLAYAKT
jgi:hypothetical protein